MKIRSRTELSIDCKAKGRCYLQSFSFDAQEKEWSIRRRWGGGLSAESERTLGRETRKPIELCRKMYCLKLCGVSKAEYSR